VRRSLARILAIPAASVCVTAGAALTAPSAFAAVTDTGGSATVTEPFSYIAQLAKHGVAEVPLSPASVSVDTTNQTVTGAFPVTGGNADVTKFFGTLNLGGTVDVASVKGKLVKLSNLQVDVVNDVITATPNGSTTPVTLLDLNGQIIIDTSTPGTQVFSSSEVDIDPAGAAYLNSALHTNAFVANGNAGTFSASWTTAKA
jgi:hypothetical protein